ncbi:MAG TPA: hypothetical protein DEQ47_05055 [Solibacterales bacterium]|nr:hypothetical protein [Bryobacterales bacterium]
MQKIAVMLLAGALTLCAQGKGKGNAGGMGNMGGMGAGRGNDRMGQTPTNSHSNAPGVTDRDLGRDRAADVGKGKKKGITRTHLKHKKHNR